MKDYRHLIGEHNSPGEEEDALNQLGYESHKDDLIFIHGKHKAERILNAEVLNDFFCQIPDGDTCRLATPKDFQKLTEIEAQIQNVDVNSSNFISILIKRLESDKKEHLGKIGLVDVNLCDLTDQYISFLKPKQDLTGNKQDKPFLKPDSEKLSLEELAIYFWYANSNASETEIIEALTANGLESLKKFQQHFNLMKVKAHRTGQRKDHSEKTVQNRLKRFNKVYSLLPDGKEKALMRDEIKSIEELLKEFS